jgi:hypothetical protein
MFDELPLCSCMVARLPRETAVILNLDAEPDGFSHAFHFLLGPECGC